MQLIVQHKNLWGMALLVAMDVLYFFSTPFWRQHAYNIFIWSHTVAVLVLIPAVSPSFGSLISVQCPTLSSRFTCTSRRSGYMPSSQLRYTDSIELSVS